MTCLYYGNGLHNISNELMYILLSSLFLFIFLRYYVQVTGYVCYELFNIYLFLWHQIVLSYVYLKQSINLLSITKQGGVKMEMEAAKLSFPRDYRKVNLYWTSQHYLRQNASPRDWNHIYTRLYLLRVQKGEPLSELEVK